MGFIGELGGADWGVRWDLSGSEVGLIGGLLGGFWVRIMLMK